MPINSSSDLSCSIDMEEDEQNMALAEEIKRILRACVRQFKIDEGDSVEEMHFKNQSLAKKMEIVLGSIEGQLGVLGHDMSSFFDEQQQQ